MRHKSFRDEVCRPRFADFVPFPQEETSFVRTDSVSNGVIVTNLEVQKVLVKDKLKEFTSDDFELANILAIGKQELESPYVSLSGLQIAESIHELP